MPTTDRYVLVRPYGHSDGPKQIAEAIARIDYLLRTQERLTAHRVFEQHPQPPAPSFPTTQHDRAQQPSEEVQKPSFSPLSRSQRGPLRPPNITNYSLRDRFKTQQDHEQQSPGEGQQAFRPEPQAPASNTPTLRHNTEQQSCRATIGRKDHTLDAADLCEEPHLPKETAMTTKARYLRLKKPQCSAAH